MRGLNLKKTEAGTRPERLSSANMGVPGAYGRNAYPQPMWGPRCVWPERLSSTNMGSQSMGSQVHGLNLKKTEAGGGGKDKAGGLILNQYGFRGACINLKKAEARTRPEGVSSTNTGSEVRGLGLKRAEARTRPEGLSSTNMGSEVRGLNQGGGKEKAGGLILNQYGVRGTRSQPGEGGGKEKAGGLILNQYGVRGTRSQPEKGAGKDKAGGLILNQYGFPRCVVST